MEKYICIYSIYCGSSYKSHFWKNRRRKCASLRDEFLYVFPLSQEFKVTQSFARFWVKKEDGSSLTTKVVEEFSRLDPDSYPRRRSGGQHNNGNWGSNRIEFAKFRGPALNGIACSCCPTRSIYR